MSKSPFFVARRSHMLAHTSGMSEPVDIEPQRFFEFVTTPGLVVVFLSFHPAHPFNDALPRHLHDKNPAIAIGRVNFVELLVFEASAVMFLRDGLRSCGVSQVFEVMPGYYLFIGGRMLAWDSGLPTTADLETLARATLLGLLAWTLTRDLMLIARAVQLGSREATAVRMATYFRAREAEYRHSPHVAPPPPPNREAELLNAYRLLGVDPSVSDDEINAAWRKLQAELHPDRAAGNPQEFERRSRLATELNRARELIRSYRARARGWAA
jgi:DnaJ-domain-containing protein 1